MQSRVCVRGVVTFGAVACAALIVMTGCASQTPAPSPAADSAGSSVATEASQGTTGTQEGELYTPTYVPNGSEIAVIKTNRGTIKVKLYGDDAPVNTANFIELAQKGFYDNVKFHRLEPGFVIQGGDPQTVGLSSKAVKAFVAKLKKGEYEQGEPMLGTGGPGYLIEDEFDPREVIHKHVDGTLAMARTDSPNSAGSQFYFTLGAQPFLDGKYTVFGDTVSGLSVVHELGVGDVIKSITIENATK